MKRSLLLFLIIPLFGISVASAKSLQARLAYATFYIPGQGPYVETYLSVTGNSVVFSPLKKGKYQAAIEVTMIFSLNDVIKHFDKYNLLSPEKEDPEKTAFNFLDQQRVQLPNGRYKFELTIKDKNQDGKPFTVTQEINIDYHENILSFSDIELLESFLESSTESKLNKGGFEILPLVDNFLPDAVNVLKFYAEIYNSSTVLNNDGFVFSYHIETFESHRVLGAFSRMQRVQAKPVSAFIKEIDISSLHSGNYKLVLEARNRNNELLASKELFFQRSKIPAVVEGNNDFTTIVVENTFAAAYTNKDTLADYIRSLWAISGPKENQFANNQLDLADLKLMQQFFYGFWEKKNPENPYDAWMQYKKEVDKVNADYSTINKKGYITERGRVYLQYGPPNTMSKQYNEPTTYPYEIWHYYKVKTQSNRKFVFYNRELGTNDFELLHSDALGEPYENQWELRLNKRTEIFNDPDKTKTKDQYGKQADDLYQNPR